MFKGLQIGQASRVIPVIGTLIPLILLVFYSQVSREISINEIWAASILTIGLIFLILPHLKGELLGWEIFLEIISSILFAFSYIFLHQAYQGASFLSVFTYSRLILIPVGLILVILPLTRNKIFSQLGTKLKLRSKTGALFIFGQICGGSAELLLTYSVALANPALVNSLQGTQYLFLFIFSIILSKKFPAIYQEKINLFNMTSKIIGLSLVLFGLILLSLSQNLKIATAQVTNGTPLEFGVTFSARYAKSLNLDPQLTFLKLLDELKLKKVRLPVYWDEIEGSQNKMDFSQIDYYLSQAEQRGVEVLLTIGYKQPRWPECFEPDWFASLAPEKQKERILSLILTEVAHFKQFKAVKIWQVENEPTLNFGHCSLGPTERAELLEQEIKIVHQLDSRPVLITDSGELSMWLKTIKLGNYFGITLYRQVWSPYFGQVDYSLFPLFYQLKNKLVRKITGSLTSETIIAELQTEPWPANPNPIPLVPIDEQIQALPFDKFQANIAFAKESGFRIAYLWGAEWWYFMNANSHPEYLEYIKSIVNYRSASDPL